jgi:hypothetical protein
VFVPEFSLYFIRPGAARLFNQSSPPFLLLNLECWNRDVTGRWDAVTKRSLTVTNQQLSSSRMKGLPSLVLRCRAV